MAKPLSHRAKLSGPPANLSPEARRLREAAFRFARTQVDERDHHDRAGDAANRALLKAALAYAEVADSRFTADQIMKVIDDLGLKMPARRGRNA